MIDFSALEGHQDMLTPGNAEVARLRADATSLVTQIDAREGLHTQTVVPLAAGMWNALYLLQPAGVVAKLSFGDNTFEVDFLRRAASLGVPAPQVFAAGHLEHPPLPDATYFLMEYIPNSANGWHMAHAENGMSGWELELIGRDLGQALAMLHSVHLGYVERLGTSVESWKQVLTDGFSPDWDDPAPNALFDDELLPIFKRILKKTDYFAFRDGTFVHGDLVLTNVLVDMDTQRLRAIIDPGGCAGMPMFDLAYAAMPWDHGYGFHHAMLDGYRQHSNQFDVAQFYTSMLVVAYRHSRFHTQEVREAVFRDILPELGI
jgi:aminoglycoside phosphotransferase (APT) family kinase protein